MAVDEITAEWTGKLHSDLKTSSGAVQRFAASTTRLRWVRFYNTSATLSVYIGEYNVGVAAFANNALHLTPHATLSFNNVDLNQWGYLSFTTAAYVKVLGSIQE